MPNKKILIAAAAVIVLILFVAFKPVRIALLVLLLLIIAALAVDVVVYINASRNGVEIKAKYFGFQVYPRKKKGGDAGETGTDEPDAGWDEDDSFEDDLDYETETVSETKPETKPEQTVQADEPDKPDVPDEPAETDKPDEPEPDGEAWDGEPDDDEPEPEKKPKKKRENPLVKKVKSLRAKYEKYKPYIPMAWKGFKQLCKTIRFYIDDAWVDIGRFDAHEAAVYYGSVQAVIAETFKDIAVMFTLKPKNVKRCDVNVRWGKNCIDGAIAMRIKVRLLTITGILIMMAVKYLAIKIKTRRQAKTQTAENTNEQA